MSSKPLQEHSLEEEDISITSKQTRKRHGARNQHRHKNMVKWIVQKFPSSIEAAKEAQESDNRATHKCHILDVAGGKGELSARMTLCHRLHVRMVDPRPANVYECFQKVVYRSLPKKWQLKISSQEPSAIRNVVHRRFRQLVQNFPSDGIDSNVIEELKLDSNLLEAVKDSTLMIGMHADGATEAIVDIALHFRKPFVVVPCCVFPNFFRHRFIPSEEDNEKMVPVRNHEQFCRYLASKDSHIIMETLPFEGRNTAIWWDGVSCDSVSV